MRLLIESGAVDINAKDNNEWTSLLFAAVESTRMLPYRNK